MRFLSVLLISGFFFCSIAHAEYNVKPWEDGYDLMQDKASAWLKTRKWSQKDIARWERIRGLPFRLSKGFDNPVCHVFADKNNRMAGREGLGKYPENPKEYVAFDNWKHKTTNKNFKYKKNVEDFITFDLYNTGKPVIISRLYYKLDGMAQVRGRFIGQMEYTDHLTDNYVYHSYNTTNVSEILNGEYAEKPIEILKDKFTVEKYRNNIEYDPYMSSFFTYDGIAYMAEKGRFVYRFDGDEKKEVCYFSLYSDEKEKKKEFSVADENMKQALAEYYSKEVRRGRTRECKEMKEIGREFFDTVNSRVPEDKQCPYDLSKIVRKMKIFKKTGGFWKTTYSLDGKYVGYLYKDKYIRDDNEHILYDVKDNKVFNVNRVQIGIIEEE